MVKKIEIDEEAKKDDENNGVNIVSSMMMMPCSLTATGHRRK